MDAYGGTHQGKDAVREILDNQEGSFTFIPGEVPPCDKTVNKPTMTILMEQVQAYGEEKNRSRHATGGRQLVTQTPSEHCSRPVGFPVCRARPICLLFCAKQRTHSRFRLSCFAEICTGAVCIPNRVKEPHDLQHRVLGNQDQAANPASRGLL